MPNALFDAVDKPTLFVALGPADRRSYAGRRVLARLADAVDRGDAPAAIGLLRAAVPDYEPSAAVMADHETERLPTSEQLARTGTG